MKLFKILRQSVILSFLLFSLLCGAESCLPVKLFHGGEMSLFDCFVSRLIVPRHDFVMYLLILYISLLLISVMAVLLIHAGCRVMEFVPGGKQFAGEMALLVRAVKHFSVRRIFRNNRIGFLFGSCGYSFFMILLWADSCRHPAWTAETFAVIARSMGLWEDTPYDVLNAPWSVDNPVTLLIHIFMWIVWGGILGAALERFVRRDLSREIRPERAKTICLSDPDFRSCLYAGMCWGNVGSLLLLAVNPLFLLFVWGCSLVRQGYVPGYWAIPVYLLCAMLSGAVCGIIGFHLFHGDAPEERAAKQ